MVVTYEFDPSSSTSMLNSVWLPAQAGLAIGHGTSSSAFIRAAAQLWIEEPGSIANGRIAFYGWWQAAGALSGANFRVGTGSFVAYTDTASVLCGGNGLMVRNDSAFTLARGRNTLTADAYASAGLGWGFGGLFLVCYTSDVPTDGVHVANKSVRLGSVPFGTPSITSEPKSEIGPFDLQASAYFINGAFALTMINQLATFSGFVAAYVADTANDDTRNTRPEDAAAFDSDTETGTVVTVFDLTQGVMRWPAQQRLRPIVDLESATAKVGYTRRSASTHFAWDFWLTYHQITFSVAGDVSDSDGGTVNLTLHRASDGEQLASTSRSGDGAYSMTWYDDTEDVYVSAYEDATHVGRSAPDTAA
jgi:hypothetical protein